MAIPVFQPIMEAVWAYRAEGGARSAIARGEDATW